MWHWKLIGLNGYAFWTEAYIVALTGEFSNGKRFMLPNSFIIHTVIKSLPGLLRMGKKA